MNHLQTIIKSSVASTGHVSGMSISSFVRRSRGFLFRFFFYFFFIGVSYIDLQFFLIFSFFSCELKKQKLYCSSPLRKHPHVSRIRVEEVIWQFAAFRAS